MKFTLVLSESALERVPREIQSHTACRNAAKKAGKGSARMLLDGATHHAAMRGLTDKEKRGRPDIAHFCL